MSKDLVRKLLFTALFAVLYIAGTFIRIPAGPVPVVLTNLFLFLGMLFLGTGWGSASVLLYLALGALGLPVFSKGGGIAQFIGPTGGYLIGYLAGVAAGGLVTKAGRRALWTAIPAVLLCALLIYVPGVSWLKYKLAMTWGKAISAGFLPFVIGDLLKGAAAVGVWLALRPLWLKLFPEPVRADG
jgi:biotin transport system substrate-specific component